MCLCVRMWLVQIIVHRGEGAGAAACSSHDGEALGGLTHRQGQGGLLGKVVSLWKDRKKKSEEVLEESLLHNRIVL